MNYIVDTILSGTIDSQSGKCKHCDEILTTDNCVLSDGWAVHAKCESEFMRTQSKMSVVGKRPKGIKLGRLNVILGKIGLALVISVKTPDGEKLKRSGTRLLIERTRGHQWFLIRKLGRILPRFERRRVILFSMNDAKLFLWDGSEISIPDDISFGEARALVRAQHLSRAFARELFFELRGNQ